MRKVLSVVLTATMAMSLAACGGSGAQRLTQRLTQRQQTQERQQVTRHLQMITTSPSSFPTYFSRQSGTTKPANIWQTW